MVKISAEEAKTETELCPVTKKAKVRKLSM